jgi:hypothetical protein
MKTTKEACEVGRRSGAAASQFAAMRPTCGSLTRRASAEGVRSPSSLPCSPPTSPGPLRSRPPPSSSPGPSLSKRRSDATAAVRGWGRAARSGAGHAARNRGRAGAGSLSQSESIRFGVVDLGADWHVPRWHVGPGASEPRRQRRDGGSSDSSVCSWQGRLPQRRFRQSKGRGFWLYLNLELPNLLGVQN